MNTFPQVVLCPLRSSCPIASNVQIMHSDPGVRDVEIIAQSASQYQAFLVQDQRGCTIAAPGKIVPEYPQTVGDLMIAATLPVSSKNSLQYPTVHSSAEQ